MQNHELFMRRCIQLARIGAGFVAPNPMVGSVLVYRDRIIGEGYHQQYGKAHAEVNCINSVSNQDRHLVKESVLYVSLEPCAHYGKTPPCADLIIQHGISQVVVGCRDPFVEVDGKGMEKLQKAGIGVIQGILQQECIELNKRFFTFHNRKRPYIILKWAQSKNQKIGNADFSRVLISNAYSNRQVHKWRSSEAAIMVGTNTALHDNPALDTRHWTGPGPVRLIVDLDLRLPTTLKVFDGSRKTIIFNTIKNEVRENLEYRLVEKDRSLVKGLLQACYELNLQSILVEGGNKLLESFINENSWDEARVIENSELLIQNGLEAPCLTNHEIISSRNIANDILSIYRNDG